MGTVEEGCVVKRDLGDSCGTVADTSCEAKGGHDGQAVQEEQKSPRTKQIEKAARMEDKWRLLRECKRFLMENTEGWKVRRTEEIQRIKSEDKERRLEVAREKEIKYR